jgi:hypothetical protein
MHDACKAECDGAIEMGSPAVVYDNKPVTKPVTAEEPVPATGKKSKKAKAPKAPKASKEKKAKKEKAAKAPKADRKPSVPKLIADVLVARVPVTTKEIIDAVLAKNSSPRNGISGTVSQRLQFGQLIGAIKKENNKYLLTF